MGRTQCGLNNLELIGTRLGLPGRTSDVHQQHDPLEQTPLPTPHHLISLKWSRPAFRAHSVPISVLTSFLCFRFSWTRVSKCMHVVQQSSHSKTQRCEYATKMANLGASSCPRVIVARGALTPEMFSSESSIYLRLLSRPGEASLKNSSLYQFISQFLSSLSHRTTKMSFHSSAEDIHIDGHHLKARLINVDGEAQDAEINLNEVLGNENGQFSWGGNSKAA